MRLHDLALLVLLLCPVPIAASAPPADDTQPIVRDDLGRELDELLAGCADWGFSGSVLVARDDRVILRNGYGLANRTTATANASDTLFEIASVSKHFTCAAILHLEEAGRLSTADSIRKWLPTVPEEHVDVTIDHLLAHTSGFPRMGPTGHGHDADAALRDYMAGGRVREPGDKYEYWNGGYALLAMIVERASGVSLETYCQEQLFVPAGMKSTGFCAETRFDERRLAHGYQEGADVGHAASHSFGWEYRGMGGVVTSVADLARWDRALRDGRILRSTRRLETAGASGYAGGGWIDSTPLGTPLIMLAGNVTGFNSQVWRMPAERAVVAVLCNNPSHGMIVCMHLVQRLYDQPGMVSMPPRPVAMDAVTLASLGGRYVADDASALVLRPVADAVVVEPWGQPAVQLIMSGDSTIPARVESMIQSAETIVRGVIEAEYVPFRAAMDENIPADWPDRFRGWWESLVEEHGAADAGSLEVLGARGTAAGPSSLEVMLRVRHERGESVFDLVFNGGRMVSCRLDRAGPIVEFRYVPTAATTLERYVLGPGASAAIEFDSAGEEVIVRAPDGATTVYRKQQSRHGFRSGS